MQHSHDGELYTGELISMLELVWGEGWLSPGGPAEVARLLKSIEVAGKEVLDIGCGVGGVDFYLVEQHHAGNITAIDVEQRVLDMAKARARQRGLLNRIDFVKVEPGPLPFPDACFGIVFSKDSIVHIPDKHALMRDVFRMLKPGGWLVASDWLIGHEGKPSPEMAAYIRAEGLDFGMASPERYRDAMEQAGFEDIFLVNRNDWYRKVAKRELKAMKGPIYKDAVAGLGQEFVDHNIDIWEKMLVVLETGEHCPHHLRGRKPE